MLADRVRMGAGARTDDWTPAPGPKGLLGGSLQEGFFGEVASAQLISGDDLAYDIGLSKGTSQHSTAGWLKFAWQNKIEFVAKKPFRYNLAWWDIGKVKAVYGGSGNATVVIGGLTYRVRLMRGADLKFNPAIYIRNQSGGGNGYSGAVCHNSEWNRLMLPIHEKAITKNWGYPDNVENDIVSWVHNLGSGAQERYSDADITVGPSGNGRYSWCQEKPYEADTVYVLCRGSEISRSNRSDFAGAALADGWRPVLELIY